MTQVRQEIPYIHLIRVVACFMVVALHSINISVNLTPGSMDAYFPRIIQLLTRPCVPLFFMISGVLLLPYNKDNDLVTYYKKRLSRVVFPLILWGGVYSILPYLLGREVLSDVWRNLIMLPFTYPTEIGGILWFLYIMIGIYLIIPFISSEAVTGRFVKVYIILWIISIFVGVIKCYEPHIMGVVPFRDYDSLLYFSGYLGYLFLGKFIHINNLKSNIIVGLLVYLICGISISLFEDSSNSLLLNNFLSPQAVIMSAVVFVIIKNYCNKISEYNFVKKISSLSFGIYLSHMVVYSVLTSKLYTISTSPIMQSIVIILTFIGAYLLSLAISKLSIKKYIIG